MTASLFEHWQRISQGGGIQASPKHAHNAHKMH